MARPTRETRLARPIPSGPFRVSAEGGAGLSVASLRTRRFRAPDRGVRIATEIPATLRLRCLGLTLVLPPTAAFGGPTSARLMLLPVPWYADDGARLLHVHLPPGSWHVRRPDVRGRRIRLPQEHVLDAVGVRLTRAGCTFVDLGEFLRLRDLVAVGDALLRDGLSDLPEIEALIRASRGRRGIRTVRRAVELLDPRSESLQESRLRVEIVEAGLPAPVPNLDIRDAAGRFLARGDLVYEAWRIVVEYDGAYHRTAAQQAADANRRTRLRENGWYVVEITAEDLREPWRAVSKVAAALRSRGAVW